VDTLTVTAELPLPDATCTGLNAHLLSAGKPEHETFTSFGKVPVFGFTVTLYTAVAPAAIDTVAGVADMEKSNAWFGKAVKLSETEWVVLAASEPIAFTWNG
jgi:hypothetical protein